MKNLAETSQLFSEKTVKLFIVVTVMMVAVLEVLDSTIVTVTLPQMMGELTANANEITWVLTSYIVASAIFMPLTGFLVHRLGQKTLLMISIVGFMLSSMACGMADNLNFMIIFRVFQGIFGAALIPLSQSILRTTFPIEQQGKAMAIWGIGIMAAPIFGPTLGGYIAENANWRWIFYINVPICLLALFLAFLFVQQTPRKYIKIDYFGLLLIAIGIGGLQIFLDQGNEHDWFDSHKLTILLIVSLICIIWFILRGLRKKDNVINLSLFKDKNFTLSTIMLGLFSAAIFSLISLQPIMLETLFNYDPLHAGYVMAPRGIAVAFAMLFVPFLMKKVSVRFILLTGVIFATVGTFFYSRLSLAADNWSIIIPSLIQGFGMGLYFVPLAVAALSTTAKNLISDGSGVYGYGRMLGSSIGISTLSTVVTRETQINWSRLDGHIQPFNPNLYRWLNQAQMSLHDKITYVRLENILQQHASMQAYLDGFFMLTIMFACLLPLTWMLGKIDISGKQPMGH